MGFVNLQDTVHHLGKSGKNLKQEIKAKTVEENCLLTH